MFSINGSKLTRTGSSSSALFKSGMATQLVCLAGFSKPKTPLESLDRGHEGVTGVIEDDRG